MVTITSERTDYKVGLTTLVLALMVAVAGVLNILLLFVFVRSKTFRRPHNLFIVNLAVADLIGALLWGIPATVAASQWKWILGNGFCQFHGFVGLLCFALNMYTLTAIALEKFLKIFAPAKHSDAFSNKTITFLVISGIWVMAFVVALLPIIGWGDFYFYNFLMQCDPDYAENETNLHFFFSTVYCIPLVASLVLFIATFIRIAVLRKKAVQNDGQVILGERKSAQKESYADKIRKQEEKFKFAGLKTKDYGEDKKKSKKKSKKKKKVNEGGEMRAEDDGYESCESVQSDDSVQGISDDDIFFTDYEGFRVYEREKAARRKRKKVFTFKRRHLSITIVMFIVWLIFVGLWGPYFVINYIWLFSPSESMEGAFTTFALLSFGSITYKPLVYLINTWIRRSVKEAFKRKKKQRKFLKPNTDQAGDEIVYSSREVHITEVHEETTTFTRSYSDVSGRPTSSQSRPSFTPGHDNKAVEVE